MLKPGRLVCLAGCFVSFGLLVVANAQNTFTNQGLRTGAYSPSVNVGGFKGRLGTSTLDRFSLDTGRGFSGQRSALGSFNYSGSGSLAGSRLADPNLGLGMQPGLGRTRGAIGSSSSLGAVAFQGGPIGSKPWAGGSRGYGGVVSPPISASAYPPAGASPTGHVIMLADTAGSEAMEEDRIVSRAAGGGAFSVLLGEGLQQANLKLMGDEAPKLTLKVATPEARPPEGEGARTYQTSLYATRQLDMARKSIGEKRYEQALVSYQAVKALAPDSSDAMIGTIYCRLITGRYQTAGLEVLRLARTEPKFWLRKPDFMIIFGVPSDRIVGSLEKTEQELDQFIVSYESHEDRASQELVAYACLGKLYLGWLSGREDVIREAIEKAGKCSPFDESIQSLYRKITGRESPKLDIQQLRPVG